jgi:NitT/TauT family transport system permease protein/taurine transport system permease protein
MAAIPKKKASCHFLKVSKLKAKTKYTIISIVSLVLFILLWEILSKTGIVSPKKLPAPSKLLDTFIYKLSNKNPDGNTIGVHIATSLKEAILGFFFGIVIGVPLGICMAWFNKFDKFFSPLFDLIKPIPPVGWVPIMITFFGIGIMSKVSVIFIASFIPAIINSYSGIKQAKDVHKWVAQTFGAKNRQVLFTVAIPSAGPMIFTGARVALNGSWVSLVAAELIASTKGLGYMIQTARLVGRIDVVFVGVLVIGIFGAIMMSLLTYLEKKFIKGGRR